MSRLALPALWLSLAGCVQNVGLGPEMGECAERPDGAFTFGEVGIGTCLAGPTDLQFVELDGKTWLVVSNADPYENFSSGSLLLVDWSTVDLALPEQGMHTVDAFASTLSRDLIDPGTKTAGDRYLGAIGLVLDRPDGVPLALVPSRFSGDSITTSIDDHLRVVSLEDPTAPTPLASLGDGLELGADPSQIVVADGRAYVASLFDQNIAVVDVHADVVSRMTVGRGASVALDRFHDLDGSGSVAGLVSSAVVTPSLMIDEEWTFRRVDASWRVWVPEAGLQRIEIGESAVVDAPTGPDIADTRMPDPITGAYAALGSDGSPLLFFGSGGNIHEAQVDQFSLDISSWAINPDVLVRGGTAGDAWNALVDAPSLADSPVNDTTLLAYDGRAEAAGPASIGIAVSNSSSEEGSEFAKGSEPVLVPAPGLSFEDPMIRSDVYTGGLRMWMSEHDGNGGWRILESRSGSGDVWTEPAAVSGLPDAASNPVVDWVNSRYQAYYTHYQAGQWWLGRAESDDGLVWHNAQDIRQIDGATDPLLAPRPAVLTNAVGGFSVAGVDSGAGAGFATDGVPYTGLLNTHGLVVEVSSGFAVQGSDLDAELAGNGLDPGAAWQLDGQTVLYATMTGSDGRRRIGLFDADGDSWSLRGSALFDLDELDLNESFEPVVAGAAGDYTMWFSASDTDGIAQIRRATSADGVAWTLAEAPALSATVDFGSDGIIPGSVQTLSDGSLRLWFTGFTREQVRIGSALSTDGGVTFVHEPGDGIEWQIGPGAPGSFDDAGVRDPRFFTIDDEEWLAYSGFDGDTWRIGLARYAGEVDEAGPWQRHTDDTGAVSAWLPAVTGTFCAAGHDHPVVTTTDDGALRIWFAGQAFVSSRLSRMGSAIGDTDTLFAEIRYPTAGDELTFRTIADGGSQGEITLNQRLDRFVTSGARITRLRHNADAGQIYVTSASGSDVLVLDVRADDGRDYLDGNVEDVEGLLRVPQSRAGQGLRDAIPLAGTDLVYASAGTPDAVLVIDASELVDDSRKQAYDDVLLASLPLRSGANDAGADGVALIGGGGMALRDQGGRRHLFVPHFRDNSLTIFDLDRGPYGEEVAYIPFIGENPHLARLTPDGNHVVVANYLGSVEDGFVSSTLTVVDANPDSPTFLQVATTLVNR